ncbi:stage III sporulation protein AA [Alicyclobacillus kakegawensis]|uniref:stage III sporulation protein AA n=1 Tax=Alicyclobacillus kakegawensis TaxID=392012 RepID=UPI0008355E59|nr:stage III sporulation protein AA [Alicyclobacillus kakegawensis]
MDAHEQRAPSVGHRSWEAVVRVCPPDILTCLEKLAESDRNRVEELRFRLGQPLQVCGDGLNAFLAPDGQLTDLPGEGVRVESEHLARVLQVVTQSSLYAVEDELRRGFVTMAGGHRVGVAGRTVLYESGTVRSVRSINSVNVRIAKERIGCADSVWSALVDNETRRPHSTLVISPPQCGKTTLLRDLARRFSEGDGRWMAGVKVTVVDERSEIAGCVDGMPQFSLGPRTDILDACPKAEGMLMAIRSLSPELVVTDEIGRAQDTDAILEATHAGVAVLASAHARSLEEWCERPYMRDLYAMRAFQRFVVLSRRRGPGTVEAILDENGRKLPVTPSVGRRPRG